MPVLGNMVDVVVLAERKGDRSYCLNRSYMLDGMQVDHRRSVPIGKGSLGFEPGSTSDHDHGRSA